MRAIRVPLKRKGNFPKRPPPPDPEKQRPGAAVTATRANRKASVGSEQPKITTRRRPTQEPDRALSMYDGRVRLASITSGGDKLVAGGDQFVVILSTGVLLGSFDTLKQATAEISAAHGGGR